jgi:hypothetical protein
LKTNGILENEDFQKQRRNEQNQTCLMHALAFLHQEFGANLDKRLLKDLPFSIIFFP